ncbi:PTS hybrid protein [Amycolatopsis arida]|uniref:Phosphocarrier protein HPr n=1 Tax=Amycolatopsis arida TaxID=587909 RepID=A0A1I5L5M9_9PSEU|nr:dihydroxyacetone kinase phosphoryl donor subunit DhaM [Amycolatopsis arida]TDX93591.1 PTS hybrid protein [Amycolatopsis arida]SFO92555.1 PTS hybrid protein [Amycolatopsis arida]
MSVGLVLVSHSAKLAEGVAELAAQMAPDVTVRPAGGLPGGGIGTDHDSVVDAVRAADTGDGVVLLYDLGSAQLTAEMVVETLESAAMVADAPLVEGAVAAAVAAQGGADMAAVAEAAAGAAAPVDLDRPEADAGASTLRLTLRNDVGLHARPAALLARGIAGIEADVRVRLGDEEADGHSVLALMSLGARQGDTIEVRASGKRADEALERIRGLVERDFDE